MPPAAFLYDVAGFSAKWLRDVAADMWPDGTVSNMRPLPAGRGPTLTDGQAQRLGRLGRAVVIVPWELYRAYGDEAILAELWPSMVAWLPARSG